MPACLRHTARVNKVSLGPANALRSNLPAFFVSSAAELTVHAPNRLRPLCLLAASELRLSHASELKTQKNPSFFLFLSLDGPGSLALVRSPAPCPVCECECGGKGTHSCTTKTLTDVCLLPPGPEERGCVRQFHLALQPGETLPSVDIRHSPSQARWTRRPAAGRCCCCCPPWIAAL